MLIGRILFKMLLAPIRVVLLFASAMMYVVSIIGTLLVGVIDICAVIAFINWISQKSYYNAKMIVIVSILINVGYFGMELITGILNILNGKVAELMSGRIVNEV